MLLPAPSHNIPPLCPSSPSVAVGDCVSAWDSPYVGPTPTLTYSYPELSPAPSSTITTLSANASTVAVLSSSASTSSYVDDLLYNCIYYNAIADSTCGVATTVVTGFPELSATQSSFQYYMNELKSSGYDNAVVGQASLSAAASYIDELHLVVTSIVGTAINTADFTKVITILVSMAQTLLDTVEGISGSASSWIGTANNELAWKKSFQNILEGFANAGPAIQELVNRNTGCSWGTQRLQRQWSALVNSAISGLNQNFPLCPTYSTIGGIYVHYVGEQYGGADCVFSPVTLVDTISCATVMPTAVSSSSSASLTSSSPTAASSSSSSFRSTTTESIYIDPSWIECFNPWFFAPYECEVTTTLSTGFPNLSASQSSFQYYMNMLSSNGYGDATDGQASLKAAASCIDGVPALLTSIQSTKLGIEDFGKVISILSSMAEVLLKTVEGISEFASAWAGDANNESVWKKSYQTMFESYGYIFQVVQLILALNMECAVGASSALNEWVTRLNSAVSGLNGNFSQCPSFSTYAPLSSTTRIPEQFYMYDYCEFSSPNVVLDNCPTAEPTSTEATSSSTSAGSTSSISSSVNSVSASTTILTEYQIPTDACTEVFVIIDSTCPITTTIATGFPDLSASQSSFQYYMNELSSSGYNNNVVGQASLSAAASCIGGLQAIMASIGSKAFSRADFSNIMSILISMAQTLVNTVEGISGHASSWVGTVNNENAWKKSFQDILEGFDNVQEVVQRIVNLNTGCIWTAESKLGQFSRLLSSAVFGLNNNFPLCPTFRDVSRLNYPYLGDKLYIAVCPWKSATLIVTTGCATVIPTAVSTSSPAVTTASSSVPSYNSVTSIEEITECIWTDVRGVPAYCSVSTTISTGFPDLSASQSSFLYYMNMLSSSGYGDAIDGHASLRAAASYIYGVPALLTSIQRTVLGEEDFGKVMAILNSMAEALLKAVQGISGNASAWAGFANNETGWKKSFQTMLESFGYSVQVIQITLYRNFECAFGASSALKEWVSNMNSAVSGLNGNFSLCPSFSTYSSLYSGVGGGFYLYELCPYSTPNVVLANCPTVTSTFTEPKFSSSSAVPTSTEPTIPSTSTEPTSQSTSTEPATSSSSPAPSSAATTLSPAASSVAVSSSSTTSSRSEPVFCTFFMVMVATTCEITTTVATGFPELSASQSSFQYYMNEISASGYDNTAVGQASLNAAASYIGGLQAILSDIERGSISIADFDKIITILVSMAQTVVTTVGGISGYVSSWAGTDNNELAWKNSFREILEGLANNGQIIQRMLDLKSGCTRGVESKLSQWSILLNSAVSTLNENFSVCPTFSSIQTLHPLQAMGIEYMVDIEVCPYTSTALVVTAGCATAMPTGMSTSSSASATTSSSTIVSESISSYKSTTSSETTESSTLPTQPSTSKIPTVTTTSVPTSSFKYSTSSTGTTTDSRCPQGTYIFSTCFIFTSNYLKPNSSCPTGAVYYGNKCFYGSSMALTECTQGYYYSGACYTPNAAARAVRVPLSAIYEVLAALI